MPERAQTERTYAYTMPEVTHAGYVTFTLAKDAQNEADTQDGDIFNVILRGEPPRDGDNRAMHEGTTEHFTVSRGVLRKMLSEVCQNREGVSDDAPAAAGDGARDVDRDHNRDAENDKDTAASQADKANALTFGKPAKGFAEIYGTKRGAVVHAPLSFFVETLEALVNDIGPDLPSDDPKAQEAAAKHPGQALQDAGVTDQNEGAVKVAASKAATMKATEDREKAEKDEERKAEDKRTADARKAEDEKGGPPELGRAPAPGADKGKAPDKGMTQGAPEPNKRR